MGGGGEQGHTLAVFAGLGASALALGSTEAAGATATTGGAALVAEAAVWGTGAVGASAGIGTGRALAQATRANANIVERMNEQHTKKRPEPASTSSVHQEETHAERGKYQGDDRA